MEDLSRLDEVMASFGLGYKWTERKKILKGIREKPIREVAQHADIVCKRNATNEKFLREQFSRERTNLTEVNLSGYANAAYIACYAPRPYCEMARKIYDNVQTVV